MSIFYIALRGHTAGYGDPILFSGSSASICRCDTHDLKCQRVPDTREVLFFFVRKCRIMHGAHVNAGLAISRSSVCSAELHQVAPLWLRFCVLLLVAFAWMDKYLWERVSVLLSRNDLISLRETSRFQSTCEWLWLGWTVVLCPQVHVIRQPCWDNFSDDECSGQMNNRGFLPTS